MRYSFLILLFFVGSTLLCNRNDAKVNSGTENKNKVMSNKIKIKVASKTFTAILLDNKTTIAFVEMLPMTINMVELNGNEKYHDLPRSLPANSSNPGTIQSGDIMLFGSKTLVLFYKTFQTSYSYTKLGRVNDTSGLAAALGSGNVTVSFEKE